MQAPPSGASSRGDRFGDPITVPLRESSRHSPKDARTRPPGLDFNTLFLAFLSGEGRIRTPGTACASHSCDCRCNLVEEPSSPMAWGRGSWV